ncbi:MAG: membrane-bound lytic murein transglycosylase F [Motiliproteus sp.]
MPKLAQARWYKNLKYGYARGYEPVKYVKNIQRYLTMLKLESRYEAIQAANDEDFIGPPVPSILARPPFTL